MSDDQKWALLADLAKLLRKYGSDTFDELSKALSDREFVERLSSLLATSSGAAKKSGLSRRPRKQQIPGTADKILSHLQQSAPEKYTLLKPLHDQAKAGTILATLSDVRHFARECGLRDLKAASRGNALVELMRLLQTLPVKDIETCLSKAEHYASADRDLAGWSRLILDKERRSRS